MVKSECPLCREEIENLPDNVEMEIMANQEEYKRETEENSFQETLAQFGGSTRELELVTALLVLNSNNIPPHLIANNITIPLNAPPGSLLRAILTETDRNVREAKEQLSLEPPELEE